MTFYVSTCNLTPQFPAGSDGLNQLTDESRWDNQQALSILRVITNFDSTANNLLSNLRWVDRAVNVRNCGVKGQIPWRYVSPAFGRLKSQYVHPVTRRKIHVGTYDDAYKAHCQALAHRLENHWIAQ